MPREPVDQPEDEDRGAESDRDRETARAWNRARMAPASPRHIEHSELTSDEPHEWRGDRGQGEREHR